MLVDFHRYLKYFRNLNNKMYIIYMLERETEEEKQRQRQW